ncbi:HAD domain-containing protein [Klebsiella pneumoniae]|uniref:HAD domain-containing protein n=1 Tax=Klebsiella TaxID=570 RepID=UPI0025525820|nr:MULTISPECIES: HAD domain-containing protein [Klebsiella]MDK9414503.1 HAD domain-containing protein [Klebsiella pneumoniae]
MTGALFSLSASGVVFAASVVILILSAMLYDSLNKRRVRNVQSYEFLASHEAATGTHPEGTVLLYLDFDGVLHRRMNESFEKMPLLEEILIQCPEILIVISSSWRETMSLEGLKHLFPVSYRHRIIGVTPSLQDVPDIEYIRYRECLSNARYLGISHFIIIDDESHRFPPGCENLVSTKYREGMTDETVSAVIMKYRQCIV